MDGMAKHSASILEWARRGAEARWSELQAEAAGLLKAFPDLASISKMAEGHLLSDLIAINASVDIVMGEVDR